MANDNPKITLDGDVSPFRQSLREASRDLIDFGNDAESSLSRAMGPLSALQEKFIAIGAVLAGGAVFKEAIRQTAEYTEESIKLGRALGISAGEASILRESLRQGNTSQEEFVTAAKGLTKSLRENEDRLKGMGLQTRDTAGNLRPLNDLVLEGVGVLNKYRAGTDRSIAGQVMFGKGFEMTSSLANMTSKDVQEVGDQMRALGIVVSAEMTAAWQEYDDASDRSTAVMGALKTTIGNALMPVLTQLGNWFSSVGPVAITVIRGAVGGLVSVFWALKTAAVGASETINATVVTLAEPVRAVSVAFWKLLQGDFSGAKAELANIPRVWSQSWSSAFASIRSDAQNSGEKIWNLFAEGTPAAKSNQGGKSAAGLLKPEKNKKEEESSLMPTYEARLAEIKNSYEQENVLRQFNKEQELAYWRELEQNYDLTSKDRLEIAKRTATLELDIRRDAAKKQLELDAVNVDAKRAAALNEVEAAEQAANGAKEIGTITQAQLIGLQEDFARRRMEIEKQALTERLALAQNDPNSTPAAKARINEQLLEADRQYAMRRRELHVQAVVESLNIWNSLADTMSSLWDKGVNALMNGTLTWRNGFRAVGAEMVSWFITDVVGAQVKGWIAGQARMLAVKLGFLAADQTATATASGVTQGIKAEETDVVVGANAAQAGAEAAKSQAGIPIVGPILAIAAMGAIFAAVMAMRTKSAAKGYDIPRGLNPMTQLHEEEMVLPKGPANTVRSLDNLPELLAQTQQALSGGGGSGGPAMHFHISAMDSRDVKRFLMDNKGHIANALKSAYRDGKR